MVCMSQHRCFLTTMPYKCHSILRDWQLMTIFWSLRLICFISIENEIFNKFWIELLFDVLMLTGSNWLVATVTRVFVRFSHLLSFPRIVFVCVSVIRAVCHCVLVAVVVVVCILLLWAEKAADILLQNTARSYLNHPNKHFILDFTGVFMYMQCAVHRQPSIQQV